MGTNYRKVERRKRGSVAVSFLVFKSSGFILPGYLRGLEGGGGIYLSEGRDEVLGTRVRVGREADEVACSFFSFSTRDSRCRWAGADARTSEAWRHAAAAWQHGRKTIQGRTRAPLPVGFREQLPHLQSPVSTIVSPRPACSLLRCSGT